MRNRNRYLEFHEKWPLTALELSEELPDRVKSRATTVRLMNGELPVRTWGNLVRLASKVPL